jgi:hypothetical protein
MTPRPRCDFFFLSQRASVNRLVEEAQGVALDRMMRY